MKYGQVAVLVLGCALAPAYAQQSGAMCDMSNLGQVRMAPDSANQQCFVQVVSKAETAGAGQLVEGNYTIALSGGGGGGGGGGADPGRPGQSAVPGQSTQYLAPGMYRLTIGGGGLGGRGCNNQTAGQDGAPTSLSNAYTGQLVAGYPQAEYWARNMHYDTAGTTQVAARSGAGGQAIVGAGSAPRATSVNGLKVAAGGAGGRGGQDCTAGQPGQNGYITITPAR